MRRAARAAARSEAVVSKKMFSWRWVLRWKGARASERSWWAAAEGRRSLISTSIRVRVRVWGGRCGGIWRRGRGDRGACGGRKRR